MAQEYAHEQSVFHYVLFEQWRPEGQMMFGASILDDSARGGLASTQNFRPKAAAHVFHAVAKSTV